MYSKILHSNLFKPIGPNEMQGRKMSETLLVMIVCSDGFQLSSSGCALLSPSRLCTFVEVTCHLVKFQSFDYIGGPIEALSGNLSFQICALHIQALYTFVQLKLWSYSLV
jgi:hypothetical protein